MSAPKTQAQVNSTLSKATNWYDFALSPMLAYSHALMFAPFGCTSVRIAMPRQGVSLQLISLEYVHLAETIFT